MLLTCNALVHLDLLVVELAEMVVSNRVRVQTLLSYQMCAIRILAYTALVNQGLVMHIIAHVIGDM